MTYTTTHGNAGLLTHWARAGTEPATSWFLVGFVNHWSTLGTPGYVCLLRNYRERKGVSGTVFLDLPVSESPWALNKNRLFCASLKTYWIRLYGKWESVFLARSARDSRTQIFEKYCFWAILDSPSLLLRALKLHVYLQMGNQPVPVVSASFTAHICSWYRRLPASRMVALCVKSTFRSILHKCLMFGECTLSWSSWCYFFFFLLGCTCGMANIPGPGIQPEPQQWQHWILHCEATRELCCYSWIETVFITNSQGAVFFLYWCLSDLQDSYSFRFSRKSYYLHFIEETSVFFSFIGAYFLVTLSQSPLEMEM